MIDYRSVDEAIAADGLRMVVVGGVPSPWGEAAKGMLHIKRIPWIAVRLAYDSEALTAWTGARNAPVAVYNDERPRAGWAEILLLAERLAPTPALLPADAAERTLVFGLAHELLGEGGLAWTHRLQLVDAGLRGTGSGFAPRVAKYLAKRYGHDAAAASGYGPRVIALLAMLAAWLKQQHAAGSRYFVGASVTAADVYAAACVGMLRPLPEAQCAMDPASRAAFESLDPATAAALDPILVEHRDMMYAQHLALPLSL